MSRFKELSERIWNLAEDSAEELEDSVFVLDADYMQVSGVPNLLLTSLNGDVNIAMEESGGEEGWHMLDWPQFEPVCSAEDIEEWLLDWFGEEEDTIGLSSYLIRYEDDDEDDEDSVDYTEAHLLSDSECVPFDDDNYSVVLDDDVRSLIAKCGFNPANVDRITFRNIVDDISDVLRLNLIGDGVF